MPRLRRRARTGPSPIRVRPRATHARVRRARDSCRLLSMRSLGYITSYSRDSSRPSSPVHFCSEFSVHRNLTHAARVLLCNRYLTAAAISRLSHLSFGSSSHRPDCVSCRPPDASAATADNLKPCLSDAAPCCSRTSSARRCPRKAATSGPFMA